MDKTAVAQVATGCALGFALWAITAPLEAWDANPVYSLLVLLAGLIASFARPSCFYCGAIGVYFGQLAGLCLLIPIAGAGPIMPGVLAVFVFGTFPAVVGAAFGGLAGHLLSKAKLAKGAKALH